MHLPQVKKKSKKFSLPDEFNEEIRAWWAASWGEAYPGKKGA